jgi:uncharacterized protein YjbI with pentapeptide repeats
LEGSAFIRHDFSIVLGEGARLSQCYLQGAKFAWSDLVNCGLHYSFLEGTDFTDADLRDAMLEGAYAQGATFDGAEMDEKAWALIRRSGGTAQNRVLKGP